MAAKSKFNLAEAAFGKDAVSKLDTEKIQRIPLHQIAANEGNFYGLREIEALAGSIQALGLLDPVVVTPLDVGYKLISGHRRLEAFRLLAKDDPQYETIPARVLPSMDQLRETLALVTANATARELTYPEKLKQEQVLRETLQEMKNAGMEVPRNLGAFMAEQLGTSRNEVSRMHSINENLIPEARALVDQGEMTAQKAYDLSRKPEAEQKDAIDSLKKVADGDLSALQPPQVDYKAVFRAALRWARASVRDWARDAVSGVTRSESIEYMKTMRGTSAYGGDMESDYCAWGKSKQVDLDHFGVSVTWTELWDALALAALERAAKEPKAPAGELWHTSPPTKNDSYICVYRTPSGSKSCSVYDWRGEWRKFGQPVGDVYEILKWTEVPK